MNSFVDVFLELAVEEVLMLVMRFPVVQKFMLDVLFDKPLKGCHSTAGIICCEELPV